jgi:hypothetical protein
MLTEKRTFLFFGLLVIIFTISISKDCFPLLTNDTECFLPTAYELKFHSELKNNIYNGNIDQNHRFIFYPPGYPKFVAYFLVNKNIQTLYFIINGITCLTILIQLFTIYILIKKWNVQLLYLPFICSLFCILSFNPFGNSRPEILGQLLFSVVVLLHILDIQRKFLIFGVLTAVVFWISPVLGIYLGLISSLIYLSEYQRINNKIADYFLGLLFTLGCCALTYEYTLPELFNGMLKHSQNVIFNRDSQRSISSFVRYHLANTNGSFGILLVIASMFVFIKHYLKKNLTLFFWLILTILILTIVYFGFRIFEMSYYVYSLSPFFIMILFKGYSKSNFKNSIFTILFLLGSMSFLYSLSNFFFIQAESKNSLTDVKSLIDNLPKNSRIGISTSFWPLIFEFEDRPISLINSNQMDFDFIIQQQYTTGLKKPIKINGYQLKENNFKNLSYSLGFYTLNYSPKYYQFALYKRK